ncbi:hypothetical protein B0H65DRAFT_62494 [Neurospora tetraspora]|uniref:Secreted protein n=1 Tax=Neurospora tetraspora TaxID=94610 RepID=A0AAE0MXF2_9PEZI|nr:hypothetical protein B0H65DRAFT_62494 [Neurospora tetraspora]
MCSLPLLFYVPFLHLQSLGGVLSPQAHPQYGWVVRSKWYLQSSDMVHWERGCRSKMRNSNIPQQLASFVLCVFRCWADIPLCVVVSLCE